MLVCITLDLSSLLLLHTCTNLICDELENSEWTRIAALAFTCHLLVQLFQTLKNRQTFLTNPRLLDAFALSLLMSTVHMTHFLAIPVPFRELIYLLSHHCVSLS